MKYEYHSKFYSLILVILVLLISTVASAKISPNDVPPNFTKSYNSNGLNVIYPKDWLFKSDNKDWKIAPETILLIAPNSDRRVLFETPELSTASIYFYKKNHQTYLDVGNKRLKELNRLHGLTDGRNTFDVRDIQQKK